MHPWFRWIFYLNPGSYGFESLMANEFDGLELECTSTQYVPYGSSYDNMSSAYRGCTILGSDESGMINGVDYIRLQYGFSPGHIWRGFGVIIGFWVFFICVTALAFELRKTSGESSTLLFKRTIRAKQSPASDPEKGIAQTRGNESAATAESARQSVLSWYDLDYHVKYQGAQKQLLNKIFGYVEPGKLVALMGSSGAGKTTRVDLFGHGNCILIYVQAPRCSCAEEGLWRNPRLYPP